MVKRGESKVIYISGAAYQAMEPPFCVVTHGETNQLLRQTDVPLFIEAQGLKRTVRHPPIHHFYSNTEGEVRFSFDEELEQIVGSLLTTLANNVAQLECAVRTQERKRHLVAKTYRVLENQISSFQKAGWLARLKFLFTNQIPGAKE